METHNHLIQGSPPVEVTFDNAREHDGGGVPCVLQGTRHAPSPHTPSVPFILLMSIAVAGMGILFFGLAANFWWLALCINVFEVRPARSPYSLLHSNIR
jgi:hypothetical protein